MSSDFDKSESFKNSKFTYKDRKGSVIDSLERIYAKDTPPVTFSSSRFTLGDLFSGSDYSFVIGFSIVVILGVCLNLYFFLF